MDVSRTEEEERFLRGMMIDRDDLIERWQEEDRMEDDEEEEQLWVSSLLANGDDNEIPVTTVEDDCTEKEPFLNEMIERWREEDHMEDDEDDQLWVSSLLAVDESVLDSTVEDDDDDDDDGDSDDNMNNERSNNLYSRRLYTTEEEASLYYLDRIWTSMLLLEDYMRRNRCDAIDSFLDMSSTSSNVGCYWNSGLALAEPDFDIPEAVQRIASNNAKRYRTSKNLVSRLYGVRPYDGSVGTIARCPCDSAELFRLFAWNHVLHSRWNNCDCTQVCLISGRVKCSDAVSVVDWLRITLDLCSEQYCNRHGRYVRALSDYSTLATAVTNDKPCEAILDGICFHTAIFLIYEDRHKRDLYGSELHKALSAWFRYQVHQRENGTNAS